MNKGTIYRVEQEQWMRHNLAEYHSTYVRDCDGLTLHFMVMRSTDGMLDMGLFYDKDIYEIVEGGVL